MNWLASHWSDIMTFLNAVGLFVVALAKRKE